MATLADLIQFNDPVWMSGGAEGGADVLRPQTIKTIAGIPVDQFIQRKGPDSVGPSGEVGPTGEVYNPQTGAWEKGYVVPGLDNTQLIPESIAKQIPGSGAYAGTTPKDTHDYTQGLQVAAMLAGGVLGGGAITGALGAGAGTAAGFGASVGTPDAFALGGGYGGLGGTAAGAGGITMGSGIYDPSLVAGTTQGAGGFTSTFPTGSAGGLQVPSALGTGNPSLGFGLTPDQVGAFGGLGGGTATGASGIANTASAASGLGGGSFLGGTNAGSLTSLLSGLGTSGGLSSIGDIAKVLSGANSLTGSSGGSTGASGGSGGASIGSTIPGLLALAYAAQQPGADTSQLQSILTGLQGNQNGIIKAATDPLQQNIAAGYGDLLQSQANRGIRGSSFGDTDIANFLNTTGTGLANAGANAAQGSLALQGNLAGQISGLGLQNQQIKNNLYGTAFDVLGRGLNPGSYGAAGGAQPTATSSGFDWNSLLKGLGGIGSGIGSLFGVGP